MELADLLLRREEVRIGIPFGPKVKEFENCWFVVPIHHSLRDGLPDDLKHDGGLALGALNGAIDWYQEDFKRYYDGLAGEKKKWVERVFMNDLPEKRDVWKCGMEMCRGWMIDVAMSQRFLYSFGLNTECNIYAETEPVMLSSVELNFSREKFAEYSIDGDVYCGDGLVPFYSCDMYAWHQHNVDTVPEAIMLRDWAILYENVLLRRMDERGLLEYRG